MQPSVNPPASETSRVSLVYLNTASLYADSDSVLTPEPSNDDGAGANALVTKVQLVDDSTQVSLTDKFFRTINIPRKVTRVTFVAKTGRIASSVQFYLNERFINDGKPALETMTASTVTGMNLFSVYGSL